MSAAVTEANTSTRQLWHIVGSGDLEQLDQLLGQGADVNAGDRTGVTPLMRAAYHGQLAMVRALIEHGADPNAKDRSGLTAMMMAKHAKHDEIVETLRSLGAQGANEGARKRRIAASGRDENVAASADHKDAIAVTPSQIPDDHKDVPPVTASQTIDDHKDAIPVTASQTIDDHKDAIPVTASQTTDDLKPATPVRPLQISDDLKDATPVTALPTTDDHKDATPVTALPTTDDHKDATSVTASLTTDDLKDATPVRPPQTRTLHEPLEIWEMVQATSAQPYVPPGGPRRVLSTRILALGVGALIICAGTVFGFVALRGVLSATDDSAEAQPETSSSKPRLSTSKPLMNLPNKTARSSNDLTKVKPVGKLMGVRSKPVTAPVAAASVSTVKKPSASQRPKDIKLTAAFLKPNKNVRKVTRLERDQDTNAKSAKKDPAPPASDPVKPSTTQKPKVIQWP
jgi:ankyrin repeat protein